MTVVEVTGQPRVDYLRAAIGLLPVRRGSELPDLELVRRGVTVDRAHLAAYQRVCGFSVGDSLPATYPHVLAFPLAMRLMSGAGFPFPVVGLVHVANRITLRAPIDAGTVLDLAVRATGLREHDRGRQFDVLATASVAGEEVWAGVSTYLRIERKGTGSRRPDGGADAHARWRVTEKTARDYAAVSGDRNPIHTSRLGARLFGFRRPIAHGMWSKARCLAALDGRLPARYTVDVAFQAPILLPGTVSFDARRTGDGFEFGLRSGRPHLAGKVTPP
jgi:acyl dehydratase